MKGRLFKSKLTVKRTLKRTIWRWNISSSKLSLDTKHIQIKKWNFQLRTSHVKNSKKVYSAQFFEYLVCCYNFCSWLLNEFNNFRRAPNCASIQKPREKKKFKTHTNFLYFTTTQNTSTWFFLITLYNRDARVLCNVPCTASFTQSHTPVASGTAKSRLKRHFPGVSE